MHIRSYTLFSTLHPVILLGYALGVPILTMCMGNPWCLLVSFGCALVMEWFYLGKQFVWQGIRGTWLLFLLIMILNFMTNHRGLITLFQTRTRRYTLESLCYGAANGLLLCAVIFWFRCFSAVLSNQKFLYLFGRRFQTAALLLSMILKLFPETQYKITQIRMAQDDSAFQEKEALKVRLKKSMRQISCLLEWSMEDSIETADSMKARGYGAGRRGQYERYHFTSYDLGALAVMLCLSGTVIMGMVLGKITFSYYPTFTWNQEMLVWNVLICFCEAGFLLMPCWMELIGAGGRRR